MKKIIKTKKYLIIFISILIFLTFIVRIIDLNEAKLLIKKNIRAFIIDNKSNFEFKKTSSNKIINSEYNITSYKNTYLKSMGPRAYFAKDDINLFLVTGTGHLMYMPIIHNNKNLPFKSIDTNFKNFANVKKNKSEIIVKDALIKDGKIYISYIFKKNDECFYNSILSGDLNTDKIKFDFFFNSDFCLNYNGYAVGGNLSDFKDNSIIIAIGDWSSYETFQTKHPQDLNNLIGKIISINTITKKNNILSIGHRNQQGLFYDKENDIIFSTEHGPQGGDELNINVKPSSQKIKNYGFPISSYGEHYGYPSEGIKYKYKEAPFYKSHKKYGFEEPLDYFVPSIGISDIEKIDNKLLVASLGSDITQGDLSLHIYTLDLNQKIKKKEILNVYERIRDIHIIEEFVLLFL
jgi:glucose/arabinose dehydrogenase